MKKNVKIPVLQKILESKIFYSMLLIAGLVYISTTLIPGAQSLTNIQKPVEEISEFENIETLTTPGMDWATQFIKDTGLTLNENSGSKHPYTYQECRYLSALNADLRRSYVGEGDYTLMVQLYAPGTAYNAFNEYKEKLSHCWDINETKQGTPETTVLEYNNNYAFNYGDTIIFGNGKKEDILKKASETLQQSQCIALTTTPRDYQRNIYTNQENYKGWIVDENITYNQPLDYNTPTFPTLLTITPKDEPEQPLPENAPPLPKTKTKPTIVEQDRKNSTYFTEKISYRIPDPQGPGCGWEWSSYKQISENNTQINQQKQEKQQATQEKVDNEAKTYLAQQDQYNIDAVFVMSETIRWNEYINEIEKVHEYWTQLEQQRTQFKPVWDQYILDYKQWLLSNHEREELAKQIEQQKKEYEQCLADNEKIRQEREENNQDDENIIDNSNNNDRVGTYIPPSLQPLKECVEPEELREKYEQPQQPTIPENMTIPESWDTIEDINIQDILAEIAEQEALLQQEEEENSTPEPTIETEPEETINNEQHQSSANENNNNNNNTTNENHEENIIGRGTNINE